MFAELINRGGVIELIFPHTNISGIWFLAVQEYAYGTNGAETSKNYASPRVTYVPLTALNSIQELKNPGKAVVVECDTHKYLVFVSPPK